jgi:hypothetical protein
LRSVALQAASRREVALVVDVEATVRGAAAMVRDVVVPRGEASVVDVEVVVVMSRLGVDVVVLKHKISSEGARTLTSRTLMPRDVTHSIGKRLKTR